MIAPAALFVVLPPTAGGGLERSTVTLLNGLDRNVLRPTLVLTHARANNRQLLATVATDIEVIELNKGGFFDQRRVVADLRRIYEARRPDAVLAQATWAGVLAMLARRGAAHQPRVVVVEHATPALMKQPRNRWLLWAARRLFPKADAVVAVGSGLAGELSAAYRLPRTKVHVIENAFDPLTDEILAGKEPLGAPFDGSSPIVLFVGRLSPEKGVDDLIRAMATVHRSSVARLVVVGQGPARAGLERLVQETGLAECVEFAGYVAKPYRLMAAADVMVVPSHLEAFSVVILEALRAAAALIVTDCDWAPREIISDGRDGLMVPVRDPAALAQAILRVLGDPELAQRLRRGARASSERYPPERTVGAYQRLILDLVAR